MVKIDLVQLQNQLDMISEDSDKMLISKDSYKIPIIAFLLSKIKSVTNEFEILIKAFESVTRVCNRTGKDTYYRVQA